MSLREPPVDHEPAFSTPTAPIWVKVGAGVIAVLVLAAIVMVVVSPSAPSQKPVSASLPAVPVTIAGSVTTLAPGAVDAQGGLGVTQQTAPPPVAGGQNGTSGGSGTGCAASSCETAPPAPTVPTAGGAQGGYGMRIATTSELAAIAADVPPPAGQSIDSVMIAKTDETWGLLHVASGGGHGQEYVVITETDGTWQAVTSGYPSVTCNQAVPDDVQADLGQGIIVCP